MHAREVCTAFVSSMHTQDIQETICGSPAAASVQLVSKMKLHTKAAVVGHRRLKMLWLPCKPCGHHDTVEHSSEGQLLASTLRESRTSSGDSNYAYGSGVQRLGLCYLGNCKQLAACRRHFPEHDIAHSTEQLIGNEGCSCQCAKPSVPQCATPSAQFEVAATHRRYAKLGLLTTLVNNVGFSICLNCELQEHVASHDMILLHNQQYFNTNLLLGDASPAAVRV